MAHITHVAHITLPYPYAVLVLYICPELPKSWICPW